MIIVLSWQVLGKIGVPRKLVNILQSLHSRFEITSSVNEVSHNLRNIIGVKQGDILGPRLFNLFMYAVMLTWHYLDNYPLCIFHSKPDFILTGRSYCALGGTVFSFSDSQYADDTAILFTSRETLEQLSPLLIAHFARFGLSIHVGTPEKASKTEILFIAALPSTYKEPNIYDDIDLSIIKLDDGTYLPIVDEFNYLSSIVQTKS